MKRLRDCFAPQIIPEAKLILAAMVSGRLAVGTVDEIADLVNEDRGTVFAGFESLRIARINLSSEPNRIKLAPEWVNQEPAKEVANVGS